MTKLQSRYFLAIALFLLAIPSVRLFFGLAWLGGVIQSQIKDRQVQERLAKYDSLPQMQAQAGQIYRRGDSFTKDDGLYRQARDLYWEIYQLTNSIDSHLNYCELTAYLEPMLATYCWQNISNYYRDRASWWRYPLLSSQTRDNKQQLAEKYQKRSSIYRELLAKCNRHHFKLPVCHRKRH